MLVRAGLDEQRITEVAGFADRKLKVKDDPLERRQPAHRDPAARSMNDTNARHRRGLSLAALASLGLAGPALAEGDTQLEPYQMVRSLQLVQDRIASGDDAALPMQRKLLEMIDKRLREASSQDFVDERNYQAMLVYAMSGGNPATIDRLLSKLHLDETDRALGTGILALSARRSADLARCACDGRSADAAAGARRIPGACQRLDHGG